MTNTLHAHKTAASYSSRMARSLCERLVFVPSNVRRGVVSLVESRSTAVSRTASSAWSSASIQVAPSKPACGGAVSQIVPRMSMRY